MAAQRRVVQPVVGVLLVAVVEELWQRLVLQPVLALLPALVQLVPELVPRVWELEREHRQP